MTALTTTSSRGCCEEDQVEVVAEVAVLTGAIRGEVPTPTTTEIATATCLRGWPSALVASSASSPCLVAANSTERTSITSTTRALSLGRMSSLTKRWLKFAETLFMHRPQTPLPIQSSDHNHSLER